MISSMSDLVHPRIKQPDQEVDNLREKQGVNDTCCMFLSTYTLSFIYIAAKYWILHLGWNVYAQKHHLSWMTKTIKQGEKVTLHSTAAAFCYSLHLQQMYILL